MGDGRACRVSLTAGRNTSRLPKCTVASSKIHVELVKNLLIFIVMLIINWIMLVIWPPVVWVLKLGVIGVIIGITSNIDPNVDYYSEMFKVLTSITIRTLSIVYSGGIFSHAIAFEFYLIWNGPAMASSLLAVPLGPYLFRFVVSLIFVGSFLLRPLVMRPVSLIWARILESDKPVFTLIFGGGAAFATAISEAAKHLSR